MSVLSNLSKLNDIIINYAFKETEYDELVKKNYAFQTTDTRGLVKKTDYNTSSYDQLPTMIMVKILLLKIILQQD